jgi:hypothetical protein
MVSCRKLKAKLYVVAFDQLKHDCPGYLFTPMNFLPKKQLIPLSLTIN